MNYIEIINAYWQLRDEGILDAGCGDLYLYLVHKSNSLGWKNPFNQSNSSICSFIRVSEPTLIRQRNVLKQIGLIDFESGKALRQNTTYYLNNISSVVSKGFSGAFSQDVSGDEGKPSDNTKLETKPSQTGSGAKAPEPKLSVEERRLKFREELKPFVTDETKSLCNEFYAYWCELSRDGKKLRFESEKFFEMKRRLGTWQRNERKKAAQPGKGVLASDDPEAQKQQRNEAVPIKLD